MCYPTPLWENIDVSSAEYIGEQVRKIHHEKFSNENSRHHLHNLQSQLMKGRLALTFRSMLCLLRVSP